MNPGLEIHRGTLPATLRVSAAFETGYHVSTRELLGGLQVSVMPLSGLPPAVLAELARLRRLHAAAAPAVLQPPARHRGP